MERAATGLSGSGGAVRVPAKQQDEENQRPADNNAAQKKAEKEAETAKRLVLTVAQQEHTGCDTPCLLRAQSYEWVYQSVQHRFATFA